MARAQAQSKRPPGTDQEGATPSARKRKSPRKQASKRKRTGSGKKTAGPAKKTTRKKTTRKKTTRKKTTRKKTARKKAGGRQGASPQRRPQANPGEAPSPGRCSLTGLPLGQAARAGWRERVEAALGDAGPCSLALVDLDEFARHNRDLGVERGDALLAAVAARLGEALGGEVALGRLGGDLFGAVFPGLAVEAALARVESARQATTAKPFVVGRGVRKRQVELTLSAGLAGLHRDAKDFPGLLTQVQAALWRAKSLGGNRVGLPGKARMVLKTSYYPQGQLDQLKRLAKRRDVKESVLLREALDDLFLKHKERGV